MEQHDTSDPDIYTSVDALRRLQFQANGFSFLPRQPVNSVLSGKNASRLRGRGLNFEEMRLYHMGDDIRTMDWKVTLRTGKPHVKVFTEERERNVILMVDQRQSMFFGSTGKTKSVVAAEVAALAAWQVFRSSDRVGVVVFNDRDAVSLTPRRSVPHIGQVLSEIVRQNHALVAGARGEDLHTSLNTTFEKLMRTLTHNCLVILISDGRGWDDRTTEMVKRVRQHNELIFCHVVDSLERELPSLSHLVLSDGEMQLQLSRHEEEAFKLYREAIADQLEVLASISARFRIPVLPFDTVTDTAQQMRRALGRAV